MSRYGQGRPSRTPARSSSAAGIRAAIDDICGARVDYKGMLGCRPEYLKIDRLFVRRRDEVQEA